IRAPVRRPPPNCRPELGHAGRDLRARCLESPRTRRRRALTPARAPAPRRRPRRAPRPDGGAAGIRRSRQRRRERPVLPGRSTCVSAENPRTDGRGIWLFDRPECPHRRTLRSGADRHRRSALGCAFARSLGGGELDNLGVMTDLSDPTAAARAAATTINAAAGIDSYDIALVLGSGWGGAADLLGETISEVPAAEVPGFHAPAVEGHGPTLRTVRIAASGKHALVLGSRTHYYEGKG